VVKFNIVDDGLFNIRYKYVKDGKYKDLLLNMWVKEVEHSFLEVSPAFWDRIPAATQKNISEKSKRKVIR